MRTAFIFVLSLTLLCHEGFAQKSATFNRDSVTKVLETIYFKDQQPQAVIASLQEKFNSNSELVKKQWNIHNKFGIVGYITDEKGKVLPKVEIFLANNLLIATSDSLGFFYVPVPETYRGWLLTFRKFGFETYKMVTDDKQKKVFEVFLKLTSKRE